MTQEELSAIAPSVFAQSPVAEVSDKYTFIPTTRLLEDCASLGWYVDTAKQRNSRVHKNHTKHILHFRSPEFPTINGISREIVVINAHDRTSSFIFMIGLHISTCLNGLIVADKIFESLRIRHIYYKFEDVEALVKTMAGHMPEVLNWIDRLQHTYMTEAQQLEFAIKAVATRFKEYVDDEGNVDSATILKAIDIPALLVPTRKADEGNNIWVVYNRVQEKLMKGGFTRVSSVDEKVRRTRGITDIKLDVDMNKALWQLASEYLVN